jgi:hypothetical protein
MNLVLKLTSTDGGLGPAEQDDGLKALVMFQDTAAGSRAIVALDRVARKIDGLGTLVCAVWSLGLLGDSSSRKIVADEASAADVVIFALNSATGLPREVDEWITSWLGRKNRRALALGAIVDGKEGRHRAAAMIAQLRQFARLGSLDFFATGGEAEEGSTLESALGRVSSAAGRGNAAVGGVPHLGMEDELKAA